MAVPKYNELFPAFITRLADGNTYTLKEICAYCADVFQLSDEDRQLQLPSGLNTLYDRVGWARSYLKKAGLVASPSRGKFYLTQEGKKALQDGAENITLTYLSL